MCKHYNLQILDENKVLFVIGKTKLRSKSSAQMFLIIVYLLGKSFNDLNTQGLVLNILDLLSPISITVKLE